MIDDVLTWCLAEVVGVEMELPSQFPDVVLRETDGSQRTLRIPVGLAEGSSIAIALKKLASPRPLTHDLVTDMLGQHRVTIEALRITAIQEAQYLAELATMGPSGPRVVPCRPSDGIALVLRRSLPTPILIGDWVFA